MKLTPILFVGLSAQILSACNTQGTTQLAGYTFHFPDDVTVVLPDGEPDPPFDTDVTISVTFPNREGLLEHVSPREFSDLPAIEIVALENVTLTGPENLNDPELGFSFKEVLPSDIRGTRKFEHIGENYRLLKYFDEEDRIKYQCSPGSVTNSACRSSVNVERIVIQYNFKYEDISLAPEIDAHLAELVQSWIRTS